jgi:butyrate kinase
MQAHESAMRLLLYRSLAESVTLPPDQRWRTIELDATFDDITDGAAIIKRQGDIPTGSLVHLVDTGNVDAWSLDLKVTKQ